MLNSGDKDTHGPGLLNLAPHNGVLVGCEMSVNPLYC